MNLDHGVFDHAKSTLKKHKRRILIASGTSALALLILAGGIFAYTSAYQDRIYPGVSIGGMELGGLTQEQARELLQETYSAMLDDGLDVVFEDPHSFSDIYTLVDLRASGATDPDLVYDLIDFDADAASDEALAIGRGENAALNVLVSLLTTIDRPQIEPVFTLAEDRIEEALREIIGDREMPSAPTDFEITIAGEEIEVEITEGIAGEELDVELALVTIESDLADFSLDTLNLELSSMHDIMKPFLAESLIEDVQEAVSAAPYTLTYTSEFGRSYSWTVSADDLTDWLLPAQNERSDEPMLTLQSESFDEFLEDISETVNIEPTDARFVIESGRVNEFSPSQDGIAFDQDETTEELVAHLGTEDTSLAITVAVTEAAVTTGNVNDLGITEVLGVGTSDFSGSPSNRIKNITHGASKLDGLLLAPGDTLSLIDQLGPFTVADGYLPELVIKGDEIKPEVGGGLCQIGTTTFRATMNAGLEVTSRRNHSLVVSYYNDPSNGNPGTDATIYDPAPDYKMTNDTENYVLLTTEVDTYNAQLIFTFWGTSDGRNGYYSPPDILSWSGYGDTQYIETLDLAPGEEQCQSPHPGATASFTYWVEYGDGSWHEKEYVSTYRSLPWLCLVGVEELSCDPEEEGCEEEEEAAEEEEETGYAEDENEEEDETDEPGEDESEEVEASEEETDE